MVIVDNNVEFIDVCVLKTNTYKYIPRTLVNSYALVEVVKEDYTSGWEVWYLRKGSRGKSYTNGVIYPANSEFGYYGWFYPTKELALIKMKELLL